MTRLTTAYGDITQQDVDVIVNAAKSSLMGGGGVAFHAISTGAYGYPLNKAAKVALREVRQFMAIEPDLKEIRFVLFTKEAARAFSLGNRLQIGYHRRFQSIDPDSLPTKYSRPSYCPETLSRFLKRAKIIT